MKNYLMIRTTLPLFALALLGAGNATSAQTLFTATLSGTQEVPVRATSATGFGTIFLNAAETLITVNESWLNLTAPATVSHLHAPAAVGVNGPVVFPFAGVPLATSGSIPEQTFAINPTQVGYLKAGLFYFNIHTSNFPGGEIRGQVTAVPEPGSIALMGSMIGIGAFSFRKYRRK